MSHQQTVRFTVCLVSKLAEGAAEVLFHIKAEWGEMERERANKNGTFGVRC